MLFESALAPFDWGVREVRAKEKHRQVIAFVTRVIDRYAPIVLVLEDWADGACRRSVRTLTLYAALADLARRKSVKLVCIPKERVKEYFASVAPPTKYEIALAIAKLIPAFSYQVPPVRKIWMSEDPRHGLYDAAALGLVYFAEDGRNDNATISTIVWP